MLISIPPPNRSARRVAEQEREQQDHGVGEPAQGHGVSASSASMRLISVQVRSYSGFSAQSMCCTRHGPMPLDQLPAVFMMVRYPADSPALGIPPIVPDNPIGPGVKISPSGT